MSNRVHTLYTQQSALQDDGTPQSTEYGLLIYDDAAEYFHPMTPTLPEFLRILTHPALALVVLSHVSVDEVSDLLAYAQQRGEVDINGATYALNRETLAAIQFLALSDPSGQDPAYWVPAAFLADYCQRHDRLSPSVQPFDQWDARDRRDFLTAAETARLLCTPDDLTALFVNRTFLYSTH
ncbi:MAG: hypothetical protein C7B46_19940 [Sulfobacillus benefaciens]|uniref:Uncharacterized protein n=1 Tax=Sulfobacillus benefaciens TaxID=453960 RepID=A0A2T2WWA2_9FIRM|nr:MAG: hypothetical protein C7B46_19940 [Sulfobacillus benefaciens]